MALGDTYNNNKDKQYSPTVYSAYGLSNIESKVDQTKLSFSYWQGLLKISLAAQKPTKGDDVQFDYENAISIYLNHTKARILFDEIAAFQANPSAYNNVGIASGAGLISLSNGKEFGVTTPCLVIRKIDTETGSTVSSYAYEFKTDYHYAVRNYEESSNDYDKVYHNSIELEQLKTLLFTYFEAMSGAMAYSIIDAMKYDNSRTHTKLDSICDKLGIDYGKKGGGSKSSTSAFNTREPRNTFSTSTLDDIASQME
jgi:hypothetical protein